MRVEICKRVAAARIFILNELNVMDMVDSWKILNERFIQLYMNDIIARISFFFFLTVYEIGRQGCTLCHLLRYAVLIFVGGL